MALGLFGLKRLVSVRIAFARMRAMMVPTSKATLPYSANGTPSSTPQAVAQRLCERAVLGRLMLWLSLELPRPMCNFERDNFLRLERNVRKSTNLADDVGLNDGHIFDFASISERNGNHLIAHPRFWLLGQVIAPDFWESLHDRVWPNGLFGRRRPLTKRKTLASREIIQQEPV